MTSIATTAVEAWQQLLQNGFDPDGWDASLAQHLREQLGLRPGDAAEQLADDELDAATFIRAFFTAVEPYMQMWDELLSLYEKAGARSGDEAVRIEYDFGGVDPPVSFDLSAFRRARSIASRSIAPFDLRDAVGDCWTLVQLLGVPHDEQTILPEDISAWVERWRSAEPWLEELPPLPPELDAQPVSVVTSVRRVWELADFVHKQVRALSTDRSELLDRGWHNDANRGEELGRHDTLEELALLESDMWVSAVVEAVHSLGTSRDDGWAEQVNAALEPLANDDPDLTALSSAVQEFLDLPTWRHRHELFANWVCAAVVDALRDLSPRVHTTGEGAIRFSATGCHLATFDAQTPRLHLMTELKTALAKPVGEGRKRAIRPDITLVYDPITDAEASPVVVECKQYLRPDNKSFAAALTDYARGRPKAAAILVDHGRVAPEIVLRSVAEEVRDRCHVIQNLTPANGPAVQQLRDLVRDALDLERVRLSQPIEVTDTLSVDVGELVNWSKAAQFVLTWEETPSDLDLYLQVTDPGGGYEISFKNMGELAMPPYAMLHRDVRDGFGPEIIEISEWIPGAEYVVSVRSFPSEEDLVITHAQVTCTFRDDHREEALVIECPPDVGSEWVVLRVRK